MQVEQIIDLKPEFKRLHAEPEFFVSARGVRWGLVVSDEELRWLWLELKKDNPTDVCVDYETYGLTQEWSEKRFIEADTAQVAGTAVAWGDKTFYVSVGHLGQRNVNEEAHKKFLVALFSQSWNLVAHNFDYELRVYKNLFKCYPKTNRLIDTMLLAFVLNKGVPKENAKGITYLLGLKDLYEHEFKQKMTRYEDVVGERKELLDETLISDIRKIIEETPKKRAKNGDGLNKGTLTDISKRIRERLERAKWRDVQINETDQKVAGEYAAADALGPLKLLQIYRPLMDQTGLWSVYFEVLAPFLKAVAELNSNGVKIDGGHLEGIADYLTPRAADLATKWDELVGCSISSNQQCADMLFNIKQLWPKQGAPRTSNGALAVNKETIKFVLKHTEPDSLAHRLAIMKQEYNRESKVVNTYTGGIIAQLPYRKDGRVRSSHSMVIVKTGRLSSNNPNFQNIPAADDENPALSIRRAFVAEEGNLLIDGDWKGLEVAVMAHYSGDHLLVRSVRDGADLHQETADKLGIARKLAKSLRFAMQYGAYPKKIAQQLDCDLATAQKLYDEFHALHPKVGVFARNVINFACVHGYVETILGRRRYVPFINSFDFKKRSKAEREAVNGTIQGSAMDIAMVAASGICEEFADLGMKSKLILQVHDENVAESPEDEVDLATKIMKKHMETRVRLNVPLRAEIGIGKTWADAK